jgi:hypothetical protein
MLSDSNFHKPMASHNGGARRRSDPIIDGVLKGVALGLAGSLLGGGDQCMGTTQLGCVLRGAAMMGVIGGVIDAMHYQTTRVIAGPPPLTPAVRWRISF